MNYKISIEKRILIAKFERTEITREIHSNISSEVEQLARDVLTKAYIYNDPDDYYSTKSVDIFQIEAVKDKLESRKVRTINVVPYCRNLTDDEFNNKMTDLLTMSSLPIELQEYIQQISWERGHSSGYSEVLSIARNMVSDLVPVINKYTQRLKTHLQNMPDNTGILDSVDG